MILYVLLGFFEILHTVELKDRALDAEGTNIPLLAKGSLTEHKGAGGYGVNLIILIIGVADMEFIALKTQDDLRSASQNQEQHEYCIVNCAFSM